jgi:aspartyl-tRNA(Asn)/glutamyl-tRNA(Gln) amidotransferase subunit A
VSDAASSVDHPALQAFAPGHLIAAAVRQGAITAEQVVRASLARIERYNPAVNAFTQVFADEAIKAAAGIDQRRKQGLAIGSLAGVPMGVKENICTVEGYTTAGSRMLASYRSPFAATVVQRACREGAIVVGKTNMDEFGMGSSTERSIFGITRNPHDLACIAGGSSGGSAAAVAAGMVPIALGTDTGGSIRQPASHCGVYGIKPTYGRASRWGLVAYASSLDQAGVLAGDVRDAAHALNAICGHDELDATSAQIESPDIVDRFEHDLNGAVIGVPRGIEAANHAAVNQTFAATQDQIRSLGARLVPVDLPDGQRCIAAYYLIAMAEASSNLARFDGIRYGHRASERKGDSVHDLMARSRAEGFGEEVQRRIMLGTHALSSGYYDAYYLTALKVRRLIKNAFDLAFEALGCHAILMPAAPGPAFAIGAKQSDPVAMYLEDVYTVSVNLAGLPAIAVPAGGASNRQRVLPIGMQLIGPALSEGTLLRLARMLAAGRSAPRAELARLDMQVAGIRPTTGAST